MPAARKGRREDRAVGSHAEFSWGCAALIAVAMAIALASCSGETKQPPPPPAPVSVATAQLQTVYKEVKTFGQVEAYQMVSVKALVGGQLTQVHFTEGQFVKQDEELFTIDPRPFEQSVRQLEGNLARDTSQAELADIEAQRSADLFKKGVASKDERDQTRTAAEAAHSVIEADRAALAGAKLSLSYCTIRSPVPGVTGKVLIHRGNVVKVNDDTLLTIMQVQPIDVTFTVPETFLTEIRSAQARKHLPVRAQIPGQPHPEQGELVFINNTVDIATGTVTLKAQFANAGLRLWPGQFVSMVLVLEEKPNAVVVPTRAIQTSQKGSFLFVIRPDKTADMRLVEVGLAMDDHTEIAKGLQAGEVVVTDGQLRLTPGSKVQTTSSATAPATGPASEPSSEPATNRGQDARETRGPNALAINGTPATRGPSP